MMAIELRLDVAGVVFDDDVVVVVDDDDFLCR